MFNRSLEQRSSNSNYSLHTQRDFKQGWLNCFRNAITCSVLLFISQDKQSDECTWKGMFVSTRNLYNYKRVVYCYFCILFTFSLPCCCCMFTCLFAFFILMLLLTVYFFIAFLMLMLLQSFCLLYLFIFVFGAFAYHFKNIISIFVTMYFL